MDLPILAKPDVSVNANRKVAAAIRIQRLFFQSRLDAHKKRGRCLQKKFNEKYDKITLSLKTKFEDIAIHDDQSSRSENICGLLRKYPKLSTDNLYNIICEDGYAPFDIIKCIIDNGGCLIDENLYTKGDFHLLIIRC